MSFRIVSIAIVAVSLFSSAALADGQKVFIGSINARRVDPELAALTREAWVKEFPTEFEVVGPQAAPAAARCADGPCVKKALAGKGIDLAVVSSVSRLGSTWEVKLALVDVQTGAIEQTTSRTVKGDEEALVAAFISASRELVGATESDAPVAEASATITPEASSTTPNTSPTQTVRIKEVNQARQKALYVCAGGAMIAAGGMTLMMLNGGPERPGIGHLAVAGGLVGFGVGGAAYVLMPHHTYRVTAAPVVSTSGAGVSIAGRF